MACAVFSINFKKNSLEQKPHKNFLKIIITSKRCSRKFANSLVSSPRTLFNFWMLIQIRNLQGILMLSWWWSTREKRVSRNEKITKNRQSIFYTQPEPNQKNIKVFLYYSCANSLTSFVFSFHRNIWSDPTDIFLSNKPGFSKVHDFIFTQSVKSPVSFYHLVLSWLWVCP